MNALLIIAHGSRRAASNDEVFILADKLRAASDVLVAGAFLELAQPSIADAIDQLVAQGATSILTFPHFLAAGTHVTQDIPDQLALAEARHPSVQFTRLPHLGSLDGIPALILQLLPAA